ncbi:MAG: hypothetical protein AB4038_18115, partial [Prochloraceae cyanobacterium]
KLRKQYLSVPEIKAQLDALELDLSESTIYLVLKQAGFARLPRTPIQYSKSRTNVLLRDLNPFFITIK